MLRKILNFDFPSMKKRLAILGSTGSIGTQALEIVDTYPELFSVEVLTANNNTDLLIKQALKYRPSIVVIANDEKYDEVYTVRKVMKDRGMIPCPGSELRLSSYKSTFK